jgi:hypothetical protein
MRATVILLNYLQILRNAKSKLSRVLLYRLDSTLSATAPGMMTTIGLGETNNYVVYGSLQTKSVREHHIHKPNIVRIRISETAGLILPSKITSARHEISIGLFSGTGAHGLSGFLRTPPQHGCRA